MNSIQVAHRPTKEWSDWVALTMVRLVRSGMDFFSCYRHEDEVAASQTDASTPRKARKSAMTERKWLVRLVFLESVAGVPGMVGGMLRHLHSLRRMKRDNGWLVVPPSHPTRC